MALINERVFCGGAQREAGGRLLLEGCLAWIECGLHQLLKDGDLTIVLCPVRDFGW